MTFSLPQENEIEAFIAWVSVLDFSSNQADWNNLGVYQSYKPLKDYNTSHVHSATFTESYSFKIHRSIENMGFMVLPNYTSAMTPIVGTLATHVVKSGSSKITILFTYNVISTRVLKLQYQ